MTQTPPSKYRKPDRAPTDADLENRRLWDQLSANSLESTQAAAEKWRAGLAAFITIVTGTFILKGPEQAADLTTTWRVVISVLVGVALSCAIVGLWLALRAAAGSPARLNFNAVVNRYGGIRQFQIACAARASEELRRAKVLVSASIVLFAGTMLAWWWAPAAHTDAPLVRVSYADHSVCGTLTAITAKDVEVAVASGVNPVRIRLADVSAMYPVTSCEK